MTDNEITYEIRGAIFDVYNELGPGLLESVYEEALFFELKERGLDVVRQKEVPIVYKDTVLKPKSVIREITSQFCNNRPGLSNCTSLCDFQAII